MDLDALKDRLGGAWYDTWWCAIFEWMTNGVYLTRLLGRNQSRMVGYV